VPREPGLVPSVVSITGVERCSPVPFGGERLPVPLNLLHYDARLPGWTCSCPYGGRQVEVRIGGTMGHWMGGCSSVRRSVLLTSRDDLAPRQRSCSRIVTSRE
jgi:hypothetical protein